MLCAALDETRVRLPATNVDPDRYAAMAKMLLQKPVLSDAERGRVIAAMVMLADEVRELREEASRANARLDALRATVCTPMTARARLPKRPRPPRESESSPRRPVRRSLPARVHTPRPPASGSPRSSPRRRA